MKISAIINAKNEEKMIVGCLDSVAFCDEIVVIDTGSTDNTVSIAKKMHAKVYTYKTDDFSEMKMIGKKKALYDWLFYIDADERVSEMLQKSIQQTIFQKNIAAYTITRQNFYFGNTPWPKKESFLRLFQKDRLKKWEGKLHETAIVEGEIGSLDGDLLHYSHQDLSLMVEKTIAWSKTEADLRFQANHPKMEWWRFPRVMMTAFLKSFVSDGGWKVGTTGVVESLYQAFSAFITYARLWELQEESKRDK